MVTKEQQINRCNVNRDAWIQSSTQPSQTSDCDQVVLTFLTINNALEYINKRQVNKMEEVSMIGYFY